VEWRDTLPALFLTCTALSAGFVLLGAAALGRRPYAWRRFAVAGALGVAAIVILLVADEHRNVLPLLPIAGSLLALVAIGWWCWTMFILGRSRGRRRCPKCWYDMSGTDSVRCPECGRAAKSEKRLHRTRRHWRLALLAILPVLLSVYFALLPRIREHGWPAALPTTALIWCLELDDNNWVFDELLRRSNSYLPSGTWMPAMPMSGDAFFTWQWRLIGKRSLEIVESDAPMQKRYSMISWLSFARYRLDGEPMAEKIDAALVRLLNDPAPQIRGRAAMSVASGHDAVSSIEFLQSVLNDEDPRARLGAVTGLRILLFESSDEVLAPLIAALDDSDGNVRLAALGALGSAARERALPVEIVDRIRHMANDVDPSVREHQVLCMARLLDDDAARAELLAAFRSGDSARRGGAIWALSMDDRFEQVEFVEELIAALTDADPMVREQAASTLGNDVNFADFIPFEAQLKAAFDRNLYPETVSFLEHTLSEFHQREVTGRLDAMEATRNGAAPQAESRAE
jgi:hypothetical protein